MNLLSLVRNRGLAPALLLLLISPTFALETFKIPEHWKDGVHALPPSSRPWIFWYWMNGNISLKGIADDLAAMKRAGIGGAMIFNIGEHVPQGKVKVYSSEWNDLMKFAISEGKRNGVDIILNNSMAGWSSSGGPWITPEYSMRKLTWSEIQVTSGTQSIKLPTPPAILNSYEDVAVLAFPTPRAEIPSQAPAKVTSSDPEFNAAAAIENPTLPPGGNNWDSGIQPSVSSSLMTKENEEGYIQWDFSEGLRAASLHIHFGPTANSSIRVIASNGDDQWKEIGAYEYRAMPINLGCRAEKAYTQWRVVFPKVNTTRKLDFYEINLSRSYRITDWSGKAMFDNEGLLDPEFPLPLDADLHDSMVSMDQVIDLTSQMNTSGDLEWKVPEGHWTILRIGHTATGSKCAPSPDATPGLECDKLNKKALELHWKNSIQPWLDQPDLNDAIKAIHIDSYERGAQNWTKAFPENFKRIKGYDLRPYLISVTGRVLDSVDQSERFLWDFRNVVTDMFHENYQQEMAELCHAAGKKFSTEAYHQNQFNNITAAGKADIPVCEVWKGDAVAGPFWMKLGASPAHVYDKQIVGCESLTAPPKGGGDYGTDFWDMKNFTDAMFCGGVNLMYFHVYVHQPQDQHLPGFSLGPYGQHFERTNTWWELMPGFTSYISRSQSLLQQGRFKADILFSCGENSPNKSLTPAGKHAVPIGYDYDVCDPKVIFERLKVVDGDLVLPNGARYEVLVLPDHRSMTLAMAKRIQELTSKGAKIIGAPPLQQPTLTTRSQEQEFHQVIDSTWQAENGVKDQSLAETLKLLGVPPDFQFTGGATLHTHREFPQGDLYFVANSTELFTKGQGVFRVKEGVPKLFDPVTGEIRSLTKYLQKDGVTSLDLEFEGKQSFFVYFDQSKAVSTNNNADFPKSNPLLTLEGPWNVLFHLVGEAPKKVVFDPLADWTLNKDDTIKYFSGKATYSKSFHLDDVRSGTSYEIDLGSFKNIAEVRLNGKELGVVWCAPWKIGIPRESLKKGNNSLEIDIVNLWPNRMIGDEQLPEDSDWSTGAWTTLTKFPDWFEKGLARTSGRKSFSSFKHWRKESPLFPSGLLGPVRVMIRDATLR